MINEEEILSIQADNLCESIDLFAKNVENYHRVLVSRGKVDDGSARKLAEKLKELKDAVQYHYTAITLHYAYRSGEAPNGQPR